MIAEFDPPVLTLADRLVADIREFMAGE